MKKSLIFTVLISIAFLNLGCTLNANNNSLPQKDTQKTEDTSNRNTDQLPDNFIEIGINDLEIGMKVSINGTTNSDGSILADRIMRGDFNGGPMILEENMEKPEFNDNNDNVKNVQAPTNFQPGNMPDFQNMTDEERQAFREQMPTSDDNRQRNQNKTFNSSSAHLSGEILKIDTDNLTLKLDGGGSKLIFISSETKVLEVKNNDLEN